jgi:hypothetical protein
MNMPPLFRTFLLIIFSIGFGLSVHSHNYIAATYAATCCVLVVTNGFLKDELDASRKRTK